MIRSQIPSLAPLGALLLATLAAPAGAQGLVPNGDFESGAAHWTSLRFDDPLGTFGVGTADVTGAGASGALFADFASPARLSHADWRSDPFLLPAGRWPVTFAVMWQKPAPVQITDPANNYAEVHLLDPSGRAVFTGHVPAPQQTNLLERRSFTGEVVVPVAGSYRALIAMQHSAAANLAYRVWLDDVIAGDRSWTLAGAGCPGTGGHVPMISGIGAPRATMRSWSIDLSEALGPGLAWLGVGWDTSSWFGIPLPVGLGGGCVVSVGWLVTFGAPVAGSGPGTGTASYPFPINPALVGVTLHAQWIVADPGSGSPFAATLTPRMTFTIQPR
ncbi:MAG: hypothetical protein IPM29_04750 [Planctomycetes bacterium]|nr:hypothetical protein [Planctomycetota bacterium]